MLAATRSHSSAKPRGWRLVARVALMACSGSVAPCIFYPQCRERAMRGTASPLAWALTRRRADPSGRFERHRADEDEGLGHRAFVGNGDIDPRRVAFRGYGRKPRQRAACERHGRPAGGKIDDAHVAEEDASAKPGAQRLGAGLLGGKSLGIGFGPPRAPLGRGALDIGEYPRQETLAVAGDRLLDAPHVDDVGTDPQDHAATRARPR